MWFGDLVTMRWWDDLWLNESFATWAGTLAQAEATRWTSAWTTFAQLYKAWAYRQDQLPSTHPIAADIPDIDAVEVNFDGITYAKGASVLKQLVAYVGRENFLDGVRKYFAAHAWGNATLADLLAALEETSGRDLAAWSAEWLQTAGVNTLRPSYSVDADGRFTEFAVEQEAPATHPVLRSHRIAIGLYDRTGDGPSSAGSGSRPTWRARARWCRNWPASRAPTWSWSTTTTSPTPRSGSMIIRCARWSARSGSSPTRSPRRCAGRPPGTWCRDGEMAARDYVRLVLSGISSVADISVVQTLLRQASQAVRRFADPGWRETGLALMASTLRDLLHEAPAGSDAQLAYVRAFAGVAISAADLALLAGLLDGSVVLDGLTVDTDLRWSLLWRLVSRGAAGRDEIDAELARDATDAGERHAAACRAAIPTAEAKQAGLGNADRGRADPRHVPRHAGRFRRPGPAGADGALPGEVLRGGRGRVAELVVGDGAGLRQRRLRGVPRFRRETVQMTDAYIGAADPPAALRRLLLEGRDDVLRALRCQDRDRQAVDAGEAAASDAGCATARMQGMSVFSSIQ